MFTEKQKRLVKHYSEDDSFCKREGAVNNYQRKLDAEALTRIYQARDAAVGPARDLLQAAVNELERHLVQRSSVILKHTTFLSQILELSFEDIPGVFYFTGGGMAKSPQLPSDATWWGNNFDLSHVSPRLCHTLIYFKNTDQELFYKTLGFAYVTSNHGITQGAARQNMLFDFGYRSEIFEYHYETPIFKHIRQQAQYGIYDTFPQALRTHYWLIQQAMYYEHSVAPSTYESNNILLFDGEKIILYPGQHPYAMCANYFDLSRVDPDARCKIIYFFPGHERVLYYDYGFSYLVSTRVNTPGATRSETIARFHNPLFAVYYAHQVWRTYDIKYPQKWELEMSQVNYNWTIEKARYDAKHKKHMAIVKSIAGIGLGALASMLVPGLGSQILTAIARGAVFGGVCSGVNGSNIAEGTFKGAFFSGVGSMCKILEVPELIRVAAIAGISSQMNDENILKSALIAIGAEVVAGQLGISSEEVLKKAFVTSTISSVLGGSDLGNALMAGAIGTVGALSQEVGEKVGNGIQNTVQEKVVEKPKKRLMITDRGKEDNLILAYNEPSNDLTTKSCEQKPISKELKIVVDEMSRILEYNDIKMSRKEIVQILEKHPNLQISKNGVEESLVKLGWIGSKKTGIPNNRENALINGVQRFVYENRSEFIRASDKYQQVFESTTIHSQNKKPNYIEKLEEINEFFDIQKNNDVEKTDKNHTLPCVISGVIDDSTYGLFSDITDTICKNKDSDPYKFGENASTVLWLRFGGPIERSLWALSEIEKSEKIYDSVSKDLNYVKNK